MTGGGRAMNSSSRKKSSITHLT